MTRNRRRPEQAAEHAARRQMIRHLLDRLDRGAILPAEAAMLRSLVTLDQADGDKHRSAAIGQQRAAQRLRGQLDAAETAIREAEQRAEWHANNAATELRVLRAGLRANGADPTQIQNLWAQIRMRNRQWREEKQRADLAEQNAEEHRADYERACKTIAAMHAAATGRTGIGPIRGVVEDVEDARARLLATARACTCPPGTRVMDHGHRAECPASLGDEPEPEHTAAPIECERPTHTHHVIPPGPECRTSREEPQP